MNQNETTEHEQPAGVEASAHDALVMRLRKYGDGVPHAPDARELMQEAANEICRMRQTAHRACDELIRMADELKQSSTIGGHWDGTEEEAREEFDRLMSLAKDLSA